MDRVRVRPGLSTSREGYVHLSMVRHTAKERQKGIPGVVWLKCRDREG